MTHLTLDDELRATASLYALGALDRDQAEAFAAHLSEGCRVCREEVQQHTRTVQALAYAAAPVAPPARLRARLLEEAPPPRPQAAATPLPSSPYGISNNSPAALTAPQAFILANEGNWTTISPGVHSKDLSGGHATIGRIYLVRVAAGAVVPTHGHKVVEHCYVLSGDARIAGRHLRQGDHHIAAVGTSHEGLTSDGGALLLITELASAA